MNQILFDVNLSNMLTTRVANQIPLSAVNLSDDNLNNLILSTYKEKASEVLNDDGVLARMSASGMSRADLLASLEKVKDEVRQRVFGRVRNR